MNVIDEETKKKYESAVEEISFIENWLTDFDKEQKKLNWEKYRGVHVSHEQLKSDFADRFREKQKKHDRKNYLKTKEARIRKAKLNGSVDVDCVCGKRFKKFSLSKHLDSKWHKDFMEVNPDAQQREIIGMENNPDGEDTPIYADGSDSDPDEELIEDDGTITKIVR